jgi:hypothetical protein
MCFEISAPHTDPCQHYSSSATPHITPEHIDDASESLVTPFPAFKSSAEEPLYTEINIPMPALPTRPKPASASLSPPPASRSRARSLSALSPFHRRRDSSSSASSTASAMESEEWPRKKEVKSREIAALMNLGQKGRRSRSGTIDALAVVPTVLVLSAELFTPGQGGGRKDSKVGRWEDSIR